MLLLFALSANAFGDIVAIIQDVKALYNVLSHSGHIQEKEDLEQSLNSFILALEYLKTVFLRPAQYLPSATVDAIQSAIEKSRGLIKDMSHRLASQSQHQQADKPFGRYLAPLYNRWSEPVRWQFKKGDLRDLQKQLQAQLNFINTHLTVMMLSKVADACVFPTNTIIMTDMLDEKIAVPLEFLLGEEVFHDFLLKHFDGRAGQSLVEQKDYLIKIRTGDGQLLDMSWSVLPGADAELDMRGILHLADVHLDMCPRCESSLLGWDMEDTICSYCQATFFGLNLNEPSLPEGDLVYNRIKDSGLMRYYNRSREADWGLIRRLAITFSPTRPSLYIRPVVGPLDGVSRLPHMNVAHIRAVL